jgi:hypothetical protein
MINACIFFFFFNSSHGALIDLSASVCYVDLNAQIKQFTMKIEVQTIMLHASQNFLLRM